MDKAILRYAVGAIELGDATAALAGLHGAMDAVVDYGCDISVATLRTELAAIRTAFQTLMHNAPMVVQ